MTSPGNISLPRLGGARPDMRALVLPETVVQFGTGAFLRGFVDFFLDQAIRSGAFAGRVVAIGSTESGRDTAINEQNGLYTLVVEGASDNGPVHESRVIRSVSRALGAQKDWGAVLELARQPSLDLVFSNTTEVGIAIEDDDNLDAAPPPSFPGKLTRFLLERGRAFGFAENAGLVVIPCELIERNGERLRELVLALARRWQIEGEFARWIERAVPFCNTLVDRIVPGAPTGERRAALEQQLGYRDDLMIAAEPYRLFAIEADATTRARLKFALADEGVVLTKDVTPYRERKVRILNGGHTLIAPLGILVGCETVLDAMKHPLLAPYLRRVLFDEIVPSLDVPEAEQFARDVLMRFANPYLRHALRDITVQQTAKMRVRVVPSVLRLVKKTGSVPASLAFGFASYLLALRGGTPIRLGIDADGERVRAAWRALSAEDDATLRRLTADVCGHVEIWHADLTQVTGFVDLVAGPLVRMVRDGVAAALQAHLGALASHDATLPAFSSER